MFGYDAVIVAGGLGVVPLRSLIRYIMYNRNDFGNVQILLGCKTPKDLLFGQETKGVDAPGGDKIQLHGGPGRPGLEGQCGFNYQPHSRSGFKSGPDLRGGGGPAGNV